MKKKSICSIVQALFVTCVGECYEVISEVQQSKCHIKNRIVEIGKILHES